mgnify:CR=1 FL=1
MRLSFEVDPVMLQAGVFIGNLVIVSDRAKVGVYRFEAALWRYINREERQAMSH